jgi:Flp pilus assembly pilin Flp
MLINTLRNILRNESGATAIEYGLIAALVSVAAITRSGGGMLEIVSLNAPTSRVKSLVPC